MYVVWVIEREGDKRRGVLQNHAFYCFPGAVSDTGYSLLTIPIKRVFDQCSLKKSLIRVRLPVHGQVLQKGIAGKLFVNR